MKLDRMVLVEGYMDVIGASQAGVTEVVALMRHGAHHRTDPRHEAAFAESASEFRSGCRGREGGGAFDQTAAG